MQQLPNLCCVVIENGILPPPAFVPLIRAWISSAYRLLDPDCRGHLRCFSDLIHTVGFQFELERTPADTQHLSRVCPVLVRLLQRC